jgi:hypothetical protein
MRALERETNLDVLRQYSLLLEAEVKRLNLENQNLKNGLKHKKQQKKKKNFILKFY